MGIETSRGGAVDRPRIVAEAALGAEREIPMYRRLALLTRHARLIVSVAVLVAGAAFLMTGLKPQEYTAESSFAPEVAQGQGSRLSGLASQLGVPMSGGGSESLAFYAALIRSRALLRGVVLTEYEIPDGEGGRESGTLVDLLPLDATSAEGRVRQAIGYVEKRLTVTPEANTGLVAVETTTESPALSEQINRRILVLVNEFNLTQRQSRATAQREFIEGRLEEARAELREAEDRLRSFLDQNRRYQESPHLMVEAERLQQEIVLRREVYRTLAESYEQARIDEVRDLPVVTVVDGPEGSATREPRRLWLTTFVGLFVGLVLGGGLAVGREYAEEQRARYPSEYEEFTRSRRAALGGLRRLLGRGPTDRV